MKTITLEVPDEQDINELIALLKPLNVKVKEEERNEITERISLIKATFGTIKNKEVISLETLKRENLYEE
jgi:hypothetical protein